MRNLLIGLSVLLGFSGCTNEQLRRSTVHQAMTLNEIQHRQVMQNLATFAANPYAIPRQVTLKDGTAQITDSGSILGQVIHDRFLNLGAERSITDMWTMQPVTNDVTLKLLQVAYRRALGSPENLYSDEFANDFAHEMKQQTYQVDDLRTTLANKKYREGPGFADNDKDTRVENPWIESQVADVVRNGFYKVASANDIYIIYPGERINERNLPVVELKNDKGQTVYREATPLAIELRRRVYQTNKDLEGILPGWLGRSHDKHEIPKDACYMAYAEECGRGCYVWVCPSGMKEFEDFTLKIIGFSGLIKEPNVTGATGVKFTPSGGAAAGGGRM